MKKIVIVLCFLGLFLSKSFAQNEIRFGFQFSPTLSWMKTDSKRVSNNGGLILGAKLGAVGEYYFQENYSIASGIGFGFNQLMSLLDCLQIVLIGAVLASVAIPEPL